MACGGGDLVRVWGSKRLRGRSRDWKGQRRARRPSAALCCGSSRATAWHNPDPKPNRLGRSQSTQNVADSPPATVVR
eukprot:5007639-Prymnesium_polylepis.1